MATYGLTATGFVIKPLEVIREEIAESLGQEFGATIKAAALRDDTAIGHLVGVISSLLSELWELAETINSSQDPDAAVDALLDALAALTGTIRLVATPSTVTLTLTGDPSTTVPSGSQASGTNGSFTTDDDATIIAVDAWASATAYVLGDRVTNSGNVYECSTAGTSAGSGGPTGTGTGEADNTAAWDYLGEGTAAVDTEATCTLNGPTIAVARDITTIDTSVSGWDGVINTEDATTGANVETDEDLRVRREVELARPGTGPADAIRADLRDVTGVTNATVFYNDTDATDADGVPPHSVEALVQGGDDQDILDQLFASVAGGVGYYGSTSGTVTDSAGSDHTVKFSRPSAVPIYVDIELTKGDDYPADGDAQVKLAIATWADSLAVGDDVYSAAVSAQCFSVTDVLNVTVADIDTSPAPSTSTPITIDTRELATIDTSDITVVST